MSAIRIEPMRPADLDAVVEIERASFPSPWSRRAFLYELEQNRVLPAGTDCPAFARRLPGSPRGLLAPQG